MSHLQHRTEFFKELQVVRWNRPNKVDHVMFSKTNQTMVGKVRLDIITKSCTAKNAEHFYHIVLASQENDFFYSSQNKWKKHMQYQHVFYVNFSDFLALLLTHIVCLKNHHSSSINQTVCFSSGSLICCESPSKALEVHMIHPKNPRRYQKKKHVTTCSRVLSHFEIWDRSIFDHPRWDVWIHCTFVPCVETAMTDCKQNGLSFRMFQCMSYT